MRTRGFADHKDLMEHYNGHVEEFGVKGMGPAEYEERADIFLGAHKTQGVLECVRPGGDKVRFNPNTNEFGILSKAGFIRTYFKPEPTIHGLPTNVDYFNWECKRKVH